MLLNKPRLVSKLKDFHTYLKNNDGKIGTKQRGIDMNLNNACNLRCKHCFTESPIGKHVKDFLPPEKIAEIADQADELGIFEWDLQGGELLLRPDILFNTLKAIKTERFYMYVTTNGWHMNEDTAKKLADHGVNRVSVSIDSMDEKVHDEFRGRKGSWQKALDALEHVQNAGMHPYLNITVGHYNAKSEDIKLMLEYSKDKKYKTLLNVATPSGMWQNLTEIMVNQEDAKYLIEMRKEYKNIMRNLWDPFDKNFENVIGCNTVNRMYITPLGDVLSCPYVHIKIGNVYENTLKEISEYGFSFKRFREYSPLCLAGEDQGFVKNFMSKKGTSIFKPVDASEIFPKDHYKEFKFDN